MKLLFSPRAVADLEEIGDYIARDNPSRALSFLDELESKCRSIASMPTAFTERADIFPGIRMAVHGNYLILFRVDKGALRIERIVHGARELGAMIEDSDL